VLLLGVVALFLPTIVEITIRPFFAEGRKKMEFKKKANLIFPPPKN
jgi:hypothetical protein